MKVMVTFLIEWVIDFAYCFAFRLSVQPSWLVYAQDAISFYFGVMVGDYDNHGWPGVYVLSNRQNWCVNAMSRFPVKFSPWVRRLLRRLFVGLFIAYFCFGAFVWWAMHQPPETFGRVMARMPGPVPFLLFPFETAWMRARAGRLHVGDPAPDFSLLKLDKSERVRLSELNRAQPVVLIFGSYTWPPFRREAPALNKLYQQYGKQVAFLVVYITEAHPSDVWQMQSNIKDAVVFASPKSEEERAFIAGACVRKLGIEFPALLDEFGNSTEQAYTGWPDRIYLIDSHGRVAYKSPPGPFGFKPEQLGIALGQTLSRTEGGLGRWVEPKEGAGNCRLTWASTRETLLFEPRG
jgi:peroxiredoxin